jgi:hypothetical protein
MSREELKVAIIIKGERIFLGALATDCDPKMTTLQGDMQTALERIPSFIEEANKEWDVSPRNPRSNVPEPVVPTRTVIPAVNSTTAIRSGQPTQPNFF